MLGVIIVAAIAGIIDGNIIAFGLVLGIGMMFALSFWAGLLVVVGALALGLAVESW